MGPIAFATNGIPIFNPYTIELNNAVEGEYAEVFDSCNGHPDQTGITLILHYMYRSILLYHQLKIAFVIQI